MVTATKRPHRSGGRRPAEIAAAVRPIAQTAASAEGLVLWGITFLRDAGRETLRVAVDREGGVTADELARCSERLSRELDRSDVVPGEARYVLEVTSPGAERRLEGAEQFRICAGRVARVTLSDGRTVEGPIAGVTDDAVEVDGAEGPVRALFSDVVKAQLIVRL